MNRMRPNFTFRLLKLEDDFHEGKNLISFRTKVVVNYNFVTVGVEKVNCFISSLIQCIM